VDDQPAAEHSVIAKHAKIPNKPLIANDIPDSDRGFMNNPG
jgi:hypothetical protein